MTRNSNCRLCSLHADCKSVCVWGVGPSRARLMLVGEAPGREEDMIGKPFIGRAGQLLDYVLDRLGLASLVYRTYIIKCRPPENKLPTRKAEREAMLQGCKRYLIDEIATVRPKIIVAMGATALQALTDHADISNWWGRAVTESVVASFGPSYVLLNPREEWKLASALSLGAKLAGVNTKQTYLKTWYDYENF